MPATRARDLEVVEVMQSFVLQSQSDEPVHRVATCVLRYAPPASWTFFLVTPAKEVMRMTTVVVVVNGSLLWGGGMGSTVRESESRDVRNAW